jgi:hypothetical protein
LVVIEPWTITCLPLQPALHAELRRASASHVVATFFQLDHSITAVASLPSFLLRLLDQLRNLRILWTVCGLVHLVVAKRTYFGLASGTMSNLSALGIAMNVRRLDPLATFWERAVYPIFSVILLILAVPKNLEFEVEQLVDVLKRDVVFSAAAWRHMRWVLDRHIEHSLQAIMTHSVTARELR